MSCQSLSQKVPLWFNHIPYESGLKLLIWSYLTIAIWWNSQVVTFVVPATIVCRDLAPLFSSRISLKIILAVYSFTPAVTNLCLSH